MNKKLAFEGVKVLDFGCWIVLPLSMKYLADHGAQVVRIEYPARLFSRGGAIRDGKRTYNQTAYFNWHETSKYGMTVNMKKPEGFEIAKRLVAWADVVGEGYEPGTVKKWGLDYEECRKIKPGIIYVSSSGQGQTGPYAHQPLLGHAILALAGMNNFTGWPDRAPVGPYGPWTDYYAPYCIITAVGAALDRQRKTGKGMYIDAAATEAGMYGTLEAFLLDYLVNGREQTRMGNRHPYAAPHGTYRCQGKESPYDNPDALFRARGEERWCSIAVFTDEEWQSFCKALGEPQWTKDPKFATLAGRKQNEDELDRLVEEWTKGYSAEEVMMLMQANGVAAGVVQNCQDLFEDPQLKHRGHFWMLDHKELGLTAFKSPSFRLSKTPPQPRAAHLLGEHNQYVLKNFLGMSDEEISELAATGVFE